MSPSAAGGRLHGRLRSQEQTLVNVVAVRLDRYGSEPVECECSRIPKIVELHPAPGAQARFGRILRADWKQRGQGIES